MIAFGKYFDSIQKHQAIISGHSAASSLLYAASDRFGMGRIYLGAKTK